MKLTTGPTIVTKRGWFWRALDVVVCGVTFGGNRDFLHGYITTIGPWIGVPDSWDPGGTLSLEQRATLDHETVHCEQFAAAGLCLLVALGTLGLALAAMVHPLWSIGPGLAVGIILTGWRTWAVVGILPLAVVYLLLPLPIGLAWGRYALEREAYAVGFETLLAHGYDRAKLIESAVGQLTTGRYGWAWPFPARVRAWFDWRLKGGG